MESVVNQHLQKYYYGKKVFVTGHTGFKGSWLITWLNLLGATVKGYALDPENEASLYNIVAPHLGIESVIADIRDKKKLEEEILSFQPDYIFHLAAQPLVRRSYEIPAETFDINVTGTANLLEAFVHLEKNCTAVIITTDKVYENKERNKLYKERSRLGGYDPYSASKACTELVAESFTKSFLSKDSEYKRALASARAGNVIGGGDWNRDRIIPDIVSHLKNDQLIPVRNPNAIRPWQHVLEPLSGYLLLGGLLTEGKDLSPSYNFGPKKNDHISVENLVDAAIGCWGKGDWRNISEASRQQTSR